MSKRIVKPRIPSGVMELLPGQLAAFKRMLDTIESCFESFGFSPLDTSLMELSKVLLTKSGGETEKQVYFVQSSGALERGYEPDMALRFDLTVPLARYVAQHERNLPFPFRRYHIDKVFRGESAQAGRYREFYQCDIDIVGRQRLSLGADAEMPAVISALFRQLNFGSFTIRISNRKLLQGILHYYAVEGEKRLELLRLVDKMDKVGKAGVLDEISSPELSSILDDFLSIEGSVDEVLRGLDGLAIENETFIAGKEELRVVCESLQERSVSEQDYCIDTSIARGLDYYTGTVYETFLDGYEKLGSVCSGGRYDNLAACFSKEELPGVGISIGATRLFYQLEAAGLLGKERASTEAMLAKLDSNLQRERFELSGELRRGGINNFVWTEGSKFKKQMSYANKASIPFVLFLGEDEYAAEEVSVKCMESGEQKRLARAKLLPFLKEQLAK